MRPYKERGMHCTDIKPSPRHSVGENKLIFSKAHDPLPLPSELHDGRQPAQPTGIYMESGEQKSILGFAQPSPVEPSSQPWFVFICVCIKENLQEDETYQVLSPATEMLKIRGTFILSPGSTLLSGNALRATNLNHIFNFNFSHGHIKKANKDRWRWF